MAILAECPQCHRRRSTKHKLCACGLDLVGAEQSGHVRFWVNYALHDGKYRREPVGFSFTEAAAIEKEKQEAARQIRLATLEKGYACDQPPKWRRLAADCYESVDWLPQVVIQKERSDGRFPWVVYRRFKNGKLRKKGSYRTLQEAKKFAKNVRPKSRKSEQMGF